MTKIFTTVSDAVGFTDSKAGDRAAAASERAAATQADYQNRALDYLMQTQRPVLEAQQGSLGRLSSLAGYGAPTQQLASEGELLANIQDSPYYQAIMGTQEAGERLILRNAAATGGLRGGGSQGALTDFGTQLQMNALTQAFQNRQQRDLQQQGFNQQGFQNQLALENSIMGQPTQTGNIAGLTAGIGQTLGQGQTAAAQARLQGSQANTQNLLNLASAGLSFFSDRRLKDDIKFAGTENGFKVYTWKWNNKAKKLGLEGVGHGVIADEVKKIKPEAVKTYMGFDTVDYDTIGVKHG
jgi:hypothetical protein